MQKIVRILSLLSLTVALILFPPAVLAYVSQNAIPGESLYGVKRVLEDGVLLIASVSPTSSAWYSYAYSKRRFRETTSLIKRQELLEASKSLKDLVEQTDKAVSQVKKIKSEEEKEKLKAELSKSINEYQKSFKAAEETLQEAPSITVSIPSPAPTVNPLATSPPIASTPTERKVSSQEDEIAKELEETRKRLDEIEKKLESNEETIDEGDSLDDLLGGLDTIDLDGLQNSLNESLNQFNSIFGL